MQQFFWLNCHILIDVSEFAFPVLAHQVIVQFINMIMNYPNALCLLTHVKPLVSSYTPWNIKKSPWFPDSFLIQRKWKEAGHIT